MTHIWLSILAAFQAAVGCEIVEPNGISERVRRVGSSQSCTWHVLV